MLPWVRTLLFCLCASAAQGGAWPREEGRAFVSTSTDQTRAQIYAEYGLRKDWTLGAEISLRKGARQPEVTGYLFRPLWRGAGGAIVSAGLAVELREPSAVWAWPQLKAEREIAVRTGLFGGKGFATPWGDGWATVELQVEKLLTTDWLDEGPALKADFGVGLKPGSRLIVLAQAQAWRRGDAKSLRLETSLGWSFGRSTVLVSPSVGVIGERAPRLRLGVWMDY